MTLTLASVISPPARTAVRAGAAVRDVILNPVIAAVLTVALLVLCTQELLALETITGQPRPYTILYLIPVTIGAAFLGVRGGVTAALLSLVLARVYLFSDNKHGLALVSLVDRAEAVEFLALAVGTLTIGVMTGSLRSTLGLLKTANRHLFDANARLANANAQLIESEAQRRAFNRDVLLAVTGGKLRLVEPDEMPPTDLVSGPPRLSLPLREPMDASLLRRQLQQLGAEMGMDADRVSDLSTGITEAATNAIKHGQGGEAQVWTGEDAVFVMVQDSGTGISPHHLARATLEQGYSTQISLGMGFHLMLQTSDTLALATGPQGTTVLLRVAIGPRVTAQEALLARYLTAA